MKIDGSLAPAAAFSTAQTPLDQLDRAVPGDTSADAHEKRLIKVFFRVAAVFLEAGTTPEGNT